MTPRRVQFQISAALVAAAAAAALLLVRRKSHPAEPQVDAKKTPLRIEKVISKVGVDARFFAQLKFAVPKWRSKTVFIVALHSCFLVLRTYLSVVVARIDGMIVRDLIASDGRAFMRSLSYWFLIAIPATYTNSMIKLTYKTQNLDNRTEGVDQLITTDVNRFCDALASLYSNLGKPILDLIIFNYQLSRSIGAKGTLALAINYLATATFGRMAAIEAKLEGDFRAAHSRVITNAEEIAFYHGGALEKSVLDSAYLALVKHLNSMSTLSTKFSQSYCPFSRRMFTIFELHTIFFYPEYAGKDTKQREAQIDAQEKSEYENRKVTGAAETLSTAAVTVDRKTGSRTQGFITNKKFLISLADAGGRIMYSYKELSELAGYTFRVYTLLRVLEDLKEDLYIKMGEHEAEYTLEDIQGTTQYGYTGIKFSDIPVVTPAGDQILVRDLSFKLDPGEHLMITGPNGSGKTSIARILSGLWPHFTGDLARPASSLSEIMYIPQRPYLPIGTLRQQIIYPHTIQEFQDSNRTDEDLFRILQTVYLDYIPAREGGLDSIKEWKDVFSGLDSIKEWKDVFSGGEKQRIQLARMFYHSPHFVVLDEATSAVSGDVEALLYTHAKEAGMTVISISHRPTLFKYHSYLLRLGEGPQGDEWFFEKISGEGADHSKLIQSVENEIRKLEGQLAGTDLLRKRLNEINAELQISSTGGAGLEGEMKHAKRTLI
ncbi:ABC transporter transmembrane region 2-domain-containing protein [Obelidium mucronatum]|nr:ABC transporter transmembrane region 2-domain-containing protein [Obelidium mucronatum]